MSLTNLCSCALIKDHKMRRIINDLLPTPPPPPRKESARLPPMNFATMKFQIPHFKIIYTPMG